MTEADLAAIQARCDAATEGPWEAVPGDHTSRRDCDGIFAPKLDGEDEWERRVIVATDSGYYPPEMPDAEFIAHSRSDVPALLAEVHRLRGLVEAAYREGWVEDGDFTIKSAWNQSESKRQLTEEGVL